MAQSDLPPVPYKTPMLDSSGFLTSPWSAWFRQLFYRVGENSALTNAQLSDLTSFPLSVQDGGTGKKTRQDAIDALFGAQSPGKYLRSDGTHATPTGIQVADIPTLNQNTTGTAGDVPYSNPASGAVARTVTTWMADQFISVKDFGALGDGTTNDTTAIASALSIGKPVYFPPGTYITTVQTISKNTIIRGAGKYLSTLKLKNGSTTDDHILYMPGDFNLTVLDMGFNGNYSGNSALPRDGGPKGVLVLTGSLHIENCYLTGVRDNAIETGNIDYNFDSTKYAHDIYIVNNIINQLTVTENLGDCMRIDRTKRGLIKGNTCIGGDSSIRSDYYCQQLVFDSNICKDNYDDVGITSALSTDITITGNICTGNGQHGIEVDAVYRGTVTGNVCSGNTRFGILIGPYGPPDSGAHFSDYLDGSLVTYPNKIGCKDVVVSGNTCVNNGEQGAALLSCNGVAFTDNWITGNNTAQDVGDIAGVYISGGVLNLDNVTLSGNHFIPGTYQTLSVQQDTVQYMTRTYGNDHRGGVQFQSAVRGATNLNPDPHLQQNSSCYVTTGALVADSTSYSGSARQVTDSSSGSSVIFQARIASTGLTDQLAYVRLRTPDTMTSVDIVINLYGAGSFLHTVYDTVTTIGSGWKDVSVQIPASLSSTYAYDTVYIQLTTDSTLTGKVNIDEVSLFGTLENPCSLALATATNNGLVSTTAQTLAGDKTFTGAVSASNISGTNTGDVSLAAVGSSPSANAASLSGQVLTLQPADSTHPGVVTTGSQTIAGTKTFTSGPIVKTAGNTIMQISTSVNGDFRAIEFIDGQASPTLYNFLIGANVNNTNVFEITPSTATGGTTFTSPAIQVDHSGAVSFGSSASATGALSGSNFSGSSSGTNTGDITLAAVGSSPSANGASLSGQALTLQPADGTHPGLVTTGSQTIAGAKTFSTAPVLNSLTASLPLQLDSSKNVTSAAIDVSGTQATGTLAAGRFPALTGDVTTSAGSLASTVAAIAGVSVGTPTGTGNVVFSASPTFTGTITGAGLSLTGSPSVKTSGNAIVKIGTSGNGNFRSIEFLDQQATPTLYNFIAGANINNTNVFEITPSTAVGGTTFTSPALQIDQSGAVTATGNTFVGGKFYITASQTPANSGATGTAGQVAWDSSFIYVCVATNTWKRVGIATW